MLKASLISAAALVMTSGLALADLAPVKEKDQFIGLVNGKTLSRPFIQLQVTPDGRISGTGGMRQVTGTWSWEAGYFCRDMKWGNRDIAYNCQEVRANGSEITFTSDRGNGDSANFRIR
ncbi:dihydrodipicolinate reductase [Pseudaestuariivita rosea]|uniref:dihydrodipicolinate reductase n=1 Tax=Pseudaestuariivita rosea TaxID=2763263 RepID=UPI001ABAB07D|nr:dihydrodipicolinate reductase [Pseudaestuariivita rosea]